ncbi:MAG: hypothetical protein J5861_03765 [Desulfovibrio sp.]|nr:hypothetical protein [Desulfovibrio sp.]
MQEPRIHQAVQAEQRFMQDRDLVTANDIAEIAERDHYAREQFVRDEGIRIGQAKDLKDGVTKRNRELALNLINLGVTRDQISQATGLSAEEIKSLSHLK